MKKLPSQDAFFWAAKIYFAAFFACGLFWVPRMARKIHPAIFDSFFEWANTSASVLIEHFVAGLGVPAFFTAAACTFVCGPWKATVKHANLKAELIVLFTAFTSAILYAAGQFGHEAMQLTLAKRSNFGQFLKDHCMPAQTIDFFGACSKQYFGVVELQIEADALGVLVFGVLLIVTVYKIRRAAMNGGDTPA